MDNKTYLLKISGSIGAAKHKEFEQTIRFVLNMLPTSCVSGHLALDVFHPDHYHVFTMWRSGEELAMFKHSDEFNLIKGSFDTLGFIDHSIAARQADVKTFLVEDDDS